MIILDIRTWYNFVDWIVKKKRKKKKIYKYLRCLSHASNPWGLGCDNHRPNRLSLPQRNTTTTAAAAANPTTSRLYPVYPFTPSSSSSSLTPSKHRLSSLPSFTSNSKPIAASAWAQSRLPRATWTFGRRWQWPMTRRRLICCAFFGLQLWDSEKNFVALISVWVLWKWRKRERNWNLSIVYFVC